MSRQIAMSKKPASIQASIVGLVAVAIAAIVVAANCCTQINAGYTGLRLWWGRIASQPLGAGLWFYCPVAGSIVDYDCREQRADFKMQAYTKDVQSAELAIVVTFAIDPSRVADLHQTVGKQYVEKILSPAVIGTTKDVIGQWEADKLINGREDATRAIFEQITKLMAEKPVRVSSYVIGNIEFSNVFEKAIEDKQVAMQDAIRAKNRTQQIEEEARQKIISAEAEAKSMQIRGDALKANPGLVQLEAVSKWDGKAPATLVIGSDASTLLSVPAAK